MGSLRGPASAEREGTHRAAHELPQDRRARGGTRDRLYLWPARDSARSEPRRDQSKELYEMTRCLMYRVLLIATAFLAAGPRTVEGQDSLSVYVPVLQHVRDTYP